MIFARVCDALHEAGRVPGPAPAGRDGRHRHAAAGARRRGGGWPRHARGGNGTTARPGGALEDLAKRTDGAFGVSFLMRFLDRDAVAVAATRSRVVEFFYADPDPTLVETVHPGGALAGRPVGSGEGAGAAGRAGG